jgi:hypothetical protein
MSLKKKIIVGVAVYLALLLALFVFVHGFPIRLRGDDQAYMAWLRNPNPQTKLLLRAQARKHEIILLKGSATAALAFWVCGSTCYVVILRLRRPSDSLTAKL